LGGGIGVRGGEGVGDVVLGLRLGVGEQPLARLNPQRVLRSAALEDVVRARVDGVGDEAVRDGAPAVAEQDVGPVVAGGRVVGGIAVQLEHAAGQRVTVGRVRV